MSIRAFTFSTNWRLVGTGLVLALSFGVVSGGRGNALSNGDGSATSASPSYSITMTPSSSELQAPPGGSTTGTFSVINEGKTGYNMSLSVAPYYVVGDSYDPQFTLLPGKTDASRWIHLSDPATQYLPGGQPQTISYMLDVPASTTPGGYYAVIFAETEPPTTKSGGVTAHNRVGDVLYITVKGPVLKQGSVVATRLPHLVLGNSLPIKLLVRDSGGLHFLTTVDFKAKSTIGNHAHFQASLQRYVLPQTQRLVTTTWSSLPLFGVYKVSRSATVFGRSQNLPVQWVIIIRPWLLVLIALLILTILILPIQHIRQRKHVKPPKGSRNT